MQEGSRKHIRHSSPRPCIQSSWNIVELPYVTDDLGFPVYRCTRGTNLIEGSVRQNIVGKFASFNASPALTDCALRYNIQVGSKNRYGITLKSIYRPIPLNYSEAVFNNYLVKPNLKAVCNAIDRSKFNWAKLGFFDGDEELVSMTKQLKRKGTFVDHRFTYKVDGVVRLQEAHDIEICVVEQAKTKRKEFWKSLYASVDVFEQLQVYFVHAVVKIFNFWREGVLNIELKLEDKEMYQRDTTNFYWIFKCKLEETLDTIKKIQSSHKNNIKKSRYNSGKTPKLLSQIINLSIIKLTENEHKQGMANLGPFDSPEHDYRLIC
ncbi:hypothetical protein [Parasitella parasitica]|uniref:Uncharacterized protein n=1 Tax=Parasitella parasitica TaxID=35722 RepID=A0A0B7NCW7_9FUNG|nr:hypothetical protein [Parasitella parasitica]